MHVTNFSIKIALGIAFLLPFLVIIRPLHEAAQVELRDALDLFSNKVTNLSVKFSLKYQFDFKWSEIALGLFLLIYGFVSFIVVPLSLLNDDLVDTMSFLLIMFVSQIFAMEIMAYYSIGYVTEYLFALVCLIERCLTSICCRKKRSLSKHSSLVVNNIRSHQARNQKSSFMIMTTIVFIMWVQAFIRQMRSESIQSVRSYVGDDFTIVTREHFRHTLKPKKRDDLNLDMIKLSEPKLKSFFHS